MSTSEPLDLDAIRERAGTATEGPWWAWDRGVGWHVAIGESEVFDVWHRPVLLLPEGERTDIGRREDAEFIAHARSDVPALLSEVERLRRDLSANERSEDAQLAIVTAERDRLRGELGAALEQIRMLRGES